MPGNQHRLLRVSLPHSPWQTCREVYLQKGWEKHMVIKTKTNYSSSDGMWKPFIWLLGIQFIYLLGFITNYFIVKLKNFCPASQIICLGFLPFCMRYVLMELSGEVSSASGMDLYCSFCLQENKKGRSELLGSAVTVLLVQWCCSMTWSGAGSPCSCLGSGRWGSVVCLECLNRQPKNNHRL